MSIKCILLHLFFFTTAVMGDLTLWYNKAATKFEEALPIGNGSLGGMVYGTVPKEKITLNESTVWDGNPGNNNKTSAASYLESARQKIFQNDATGACDVTKNMIGGGEASYQPAGTLYIDFSGHTATNYHRELDLKTAISKTTYTYSGVTYTREYFASYTDQVIVIRLTANQTGKITYTMSLDCPHDNNNISVSGNDLLLLNATVNSIKFQTRVKVKSEGGIVSAGNNTIKVDGANSSTIILATGTNFNSYNDLNGNQVSRAEKCITDANAKTYEKILEDHLSSYKELFDRTDIELGTPTNDSTLTTDAQVQRFNTSNDPQLVRLYYQFGRYLMISSSRGQSQPANLQGVWNESKSPSWGSKYTININTEMNYWMTESANLPECAEPLFTKIKSMVAPGKVTAKAHWGSERGWVAHHNTDLWNRTAPIDGTWGHWPTGGAWLSTHLWEHFLYSRDEVFLADAYSTMKGAAEFFLATMVEEPFTGKKYLGTCPSASPENNPGAWGAWNCDVSFAPTMDIQIIRDILNYTIEASKILNVDPDFRSEAETALKRLPPSQIGKHGQLQEWFKDWDNPSDAHRHVSHLYGLFPSAQISLRGTPELANAAKTTLIQRGDMSTGWSLAWKLNLWARLEDGNHAYTLIQMLLTPDRTYANLFDAHPPFQIDGNFGAVSGINEMLLQSHNDEINFLPAIPGKWAKGSFRGIRARKGFLIDSVQWSNKTLNRALVSSTVGGICNVRHRNTTSSFETEKGMTYVLDGSLNIINKYRTDGHTGINRNFINKPDNKSFTVKRKVGKPSVKFFTNPGNLKIQMTGLSGVSVRVFNLSGRMIYEFSQKADFNTSISIPHLTRGIYLVSVNSMKLNKFEKIILK